MNKDKLPWMKFYPNDWLSDGALRTCSLAARGLWMDMLCLMQQTEPRGYLQNGDKIITKSDLKLIENLHKTRLKTLLNELETHGVFSVDERGCIYSRRLVHDEHIRNVRKDAGSKGGIATAKEYGLPQQKNKFCRSLEAEGETEVEAKGIGTGIDSEENTYSPTPHERRLIAGKEAPRKYGEKFLLFWERYPKTMRVDKREAWQIWCEKNLDNEFDELMAGLTRYKRSQHWQKEAGRFIMSPKKFVDKTKWDDEPILSDANRG